MTGITAHLHDVHEAAGLDHVRPICQNSVYFLQNSETIRTGPFEVTIGFRSEAKIAGSIPGLPAGRHGQQQAGWGDYLHAVRE